MNDIESIIFREQQRFTQGWLWVLIFGIALLAVYIFIQQVIFGRPFGNNPAPDWAVILILILIGIDLPALFCCIRMTTEVRRGGLYVRFFPFHLSYRKIPLENLVNHEVRTYQPIREYGGWGIKDGSAGKAYNICGNRGVQLVYSDGRRMLIGSEKPEELLAAIEAVLKIRKLSIQTGPGR